LKQKIKHYLKEGVIFLLVMSILANILSLYNAQTLNKQPLTLKEITLLSGEKFHIDPTKPVLIHFWATWCPTCKLEADNIQRISNYYQVVTIAVNSGANEDILKYLKEKDLSFRVVNDQYGIYAKEFQIAGYPTTFIYNAEQKLVFSEVGYTSSFGLWLRMIWSSL